MNDLFSSSDYSQPSWTDTLTSILGDAASSYNTYTLAQQGIGVVPGVGYSAPVGTQFYSPTGNVVPTIQQQQQQTSTLLLLLVFGGLALFAIKEMK